MRACARACVCARVRARIIHYFFYFQHNKHNNLIKSIGYPLYWRTTNVVTLLKSQQIYPQKGKNKDPQK